MATTLPAVLFVALVSAAPEAGDWPSLTAAVHSATPEATAPPFTRSCLRAALGPDGEDPRETVGASTRELIRLLHDLGLSYCYQAKDERHRGNTDDASRYDALGLAAFMRVDALVDEFGEDVPEELQKIVARTKRILALAREHKVVPAEQPLGLGPDYLLTAEQCLRTAQLGAPDDRWKLVRAFHLVRLRARQTPLTKDDVDVRTFEQVVRADEVGPEDERDAMRFAVSRELKRARPTAHEKPVQSVAPRVDFTGRAEPVGEPSDRQPARGRSAAVPLAALGAATVTGGVFQVVWGSTMQRVTVREFANPPTPAQQEYLDDTIAPRKRLHWGVGSAVIVTGVAALTTAIILRARTKGRRRARAGRGEQ